MVYETPIIETERLILKRGNIEDYKKFMNMILLN